MITYLPIYYYPIGEIIFPYWKKNAHLFQVVFKHYFVIY